jgi:hypothetical protein
MRRSSLVSLLTVGLILSGCVRSASSLWGGAGNATPLPIPTPGPTGFPLNVGSTWIYDYSSRFEDEEASWNVMDTIIEVANSDGFLVATVEQVVTPKSGDTDEDFLNGPETKNFWYLYDGVRLYKVDEEPDPIDLTEAWLELVFPLTKPGCWFPDALQRKEMGGVVTASAPVAGCRAVSGAAHTVENPAGMFTNCLDVVTPYESGPIVITFCPGIGIVATRFEPDETYFSYYSTLTGYILP